MNTESKRSYKIAGKKKETSTITTLILLPAEGGKPPFASGQFLTVYFPELGTAEGKAYSISSAPHEEALSITVKEIGAYSRKLASMSVGDTITASGPYGFFYSEEDDSHLVLVAGGIGIAPFRSMVCSMLYAAPERKITLYYSAPSWEEAAFADELHVLEEAHTTFSCLFHSTRAESGKPGVREGRISTDELFSESKKAPRTEYLMCGSIAFVRDMWKGLKERGIPEDRLYTEAFFS